MFEKLDDFFGSYIETAANGLGGVVNVLLGVFGVLVMVVSFPLWLIGKLSAQQGVQPTDGGQSQADSESNPPTISR